MWVNGWLETGRRSTLNGHAGGNPGYSQGRAYELPRQSFTRQDAYAIVKRLLGLAYFWCGAQNAVELQLGATWLLYAVLVDLTDAVAEALAQPFAHVSLEMVYRRLYFFTHAYHRGEATDVVVYLAANAKLLGILKRPRKPARQQQPACAHGP